MMNIAFVATRLTKYDAASNYTAAVLEELSRSYTVHLYAFSIEREIQKGVKKCTYTRKNKHNLSSVLSVTTKICSLAKKFSKYDIVVLAGPDITILPSIHLAKCFNPNLKLIWDFHGLTPPRFIQSDMQKFLTRIRQMAYFWSMKRSDAVKVDSNYIKKEVEDAVGKRNTVVLPIGINTTIFQNTDIKAIKDKHHLNDKFVMIYVGRLAASKRVDFLIKAMPYLDETVLLIIGDGDEKNKLENLSHSLNLKDKVIFVGSVSDETLPKYYAASDIFVTASLHEGFCVPIIESLASGKPVIVPNRTAMPEVAGDVGLLYDGSIEEFIKRVEIMKNHESRVHFSSRAGELAKKFDIKAVSLEYMRLLEKIYAGRIFPLNKDEYGRENPD